MPNRTVASASRPAVVAMAVLVAGAILVHAAPAPPGSWGPTAAVGALGLSSTTAPAPSDGGTPPRGEATRGVLHYPGGRPAPAGLQRDAPVAKLSYTGIFGLEPTLGVLGDGTVVVQGALRRHVGDYDLGLVPAVLRSRDRGASWDDVSPGTHQATQDPYLAVDQRTDRIFTTDWMGCIQLSSSDDSGETWTARGPVCGEVLDHQTVFMGPPVTSAPIGYPNVVYLCAISYGFATPSSAGTQCLKSLDGGTTFVVTGEPAFLAQPGAGKGSMGVDGLCDGASGHGTVGSDGTVYVPKGYCGQPFLAISRDEGLTWDRVQVADTGMARQSSGTPDHEAGVVADDDGNVYYTWVAEDRLPYIAVSRDGGLTWAAPMMIAPPGVRETVLPGIAIGPEGRLAVVYMGSSDSPGAPWDAADYAEVTWNGYVTVIDEPMDRLPLLASVSLNDPRDPLIRGTCGPFRCQAEFDFIDVQIGPDGTPWASLVDGCGEGLQALDRDERGCYLIGELVVGEVVAGRQRRGP